jgi:PAS domain S-box-containing protein
LPHNAAIAGQRKEYGPTASDQAVMGAAKMERRRALMAELRSFVGLTDIDADLLARFRSSAKPRFPAIADEFYAVIRMHPGALAVLQDEAQARRLYASLLVWLGELLSGPYDEGYVERHARIGHVHVRVGLELRYTVAAMSRVCVSLQQTASNALADNPAASAATRLAITRICNLDLAIMLESYKDDLVGRAQQASASEHDTIRSQLDERKRLLEDVQQAASVVLLGLDAGGHVVIANPKTEQLTGYARNEMAHLDIFELLFGARAAPMRASLMAAAQGEPVELEAETLTRSGKMRTVLWRAAAHRASEVDAPTVVVVGVDVTKEREIERRTRHNERLAATGALAAGLAHEIRNPLNGASLHLSVIERGLARYPDVPAPVREATEVLRNEIRRLGGLVTDFLEVARPKSLVLADCDLNALVQSVRTLLAPEAESRRISLAVEVSPFPVVMRLDIARTKQVVVNLVRNAFDAVKEGGTVIIRVRRLPEHVELDVADDGAGISDPNAPIFDAFYTTKDAGTGLGLSVVQRIVTDHDGDVSFSSQPGATVFTVRLPLTPAQSCSTCDEPA